MAVGTTADAVIKRNRVVELALRACRAAKNGQTLDNNMMRDGVATLNELLRQEDQEQTGQSISLWAMAENHLFLAPGIYSYGVSEGLAADIRDIQTVTYRDHTGADTPLKLISKPHYESLSPKNETGDPLYVYLTEDRVLASQSVKVWPVPASISTVSVVVGSDALQYMCILKHTSDTDTKPITGTNYQMFWRQAGSGGSAWVDATEYGNSEIIRISYKRPLYDFDLADSDPDLPLGWGLYLKWRLAMELSPMYKVPLEERGWFAQQASKCSQQLFPATRNKTQDYHNKAVYF
jgi:hypothetical protein